jgi:hypothetical protein
MRSARRIALLLAHADMRTGHEAAAFRAKAASLAGAKPVGFVAAAYAAEVGRRETFSRMF